MSIGMFDHDLYNYGSTMFNLELMKLSTYYKNKKEIVLLASSIDVNKYSKIFFRKDYNDGSFPLSIHNPKVEYGGMAFTNNIYVPMDESIEICKADSFLYSRASSFYQGESQAKFFAMSKAVHMRLSLDSQTIWDKYEKQFAPFKGCLGLCVHDYDIAKIKDSYQIITELLDELPKNKRSNKLIIKYPIRTYSNEEFIRWRRVKNLKTNYSIIHSGLLDDSSIIDFVKADPTQRGASKYEYNVTYGCSSENDFIFRVLPEIFKQAVFLRRNLHNFPLTYDQDFFIDKRWEKVVGLLSLFINNFKVYKGNLRQERIDKRCFYDFVKRYHDIHGRNLHLHKYSIEDCREAFEVVLENNYEVFKMFYTPLRVIEKGDKLIYD